MTDSQTTDLPTLIAHRRQAHSQLESVVKKEAFINTLRKSLGRLTSDIKVGTRFISTNDYDGNLYECKQEPYFDLLSKPVIRDSEGKQSVEKVECRASVFQIDLCRIKFPEPVLLKTSLSSPGYIQETPEHDRFFETVEEDGYINIPNVKKYSFLDFGDVFKAANLIRDKRIAENNDDYRIKWNNTAYESRGTVLDYYTPDEITFCIQHIRKTTIQRQDERGNVWSSYIAEGYFPEIQREVSRIWIRKCNIIGEALGKNIDSSHKCINFTQEIMSVRDMLLDEREKLTKVRKVFNEHYPAKCRSKSLRSLTAESERLQPTLERLTKLLDDMWSSDVKVPAYYCKKYGYLIPIKAEFIVDVSGNTLEVDMATQQQKIHTAVENQSALRKAVVEEVLPAALHPSRVEKEIEKHDIDGTFGDDKVVAHDWKTGKTGVVNESVFG
jgi:hypothetical protein